MKKMEKQQNRNLMDRAGKLADIMFKFKKICNEKEAYFAYKVGLTPVEFRCLKYLDGQEYLIIKDLAEKMNLKLSRITRLITSLEEKKYIKRKLDSGDRRHVRVYFNKNKQNELDKINREYILLHGEILSSLPTEFAEQAVNDLQDIYDVFEEWTEKNIHKK